MEKNKIPTIEDLKTEEYLKGEGCPNGQEVVIDAVGNVTSVPKTN
jgi:hypothetical protein